MLDKINIGKITKKNSLKVGILILSTQKDYQYISNLKTSYTQIDKLVESLDNLSGPSMQ